MLIGSEIGPSPDLIPWLRTKKEVFDDDKKDTGCLFTSSVSLSWTPFYFLRFCVLGVMKEEDILMRDSFMSWALFGIMFDGLLHVGVLSIVRGYSWDTVLFQEKNI